MSKLTKYHAIEQFRHTVHNVVQQAQYQGLDAEGLPIIDKCAPLPIVTFTGTVKLHGTNSSVCQSADGELWCQSRNNIITPEKDNAGFALWAKGREGFWHWFFNRLRARNSEYVNKTLALFGEWCGKGIQKNVSISGLPKMFVVFDVKVVPENEEERPYPMPRVEWGKLINKGYGDSIHNINMFYTFSIDIDFSCAELAQNKLITITEAVERECPVGRALGINPGRDCTTGEGVVWTGEYKGVKHVFKVKGEKHSVSKVKTLAAVDTEKIKSILDFVEYAVTENRLNQAVEQVFTAKGVSLDIKGTGDFLRWLVNDIAKEESDTLRDNGLEPKDVNRELSLKARPWFMLKIATP